MQKAPSQGSWSHHLNPLGPPPGTPLALVLGSGRSSCTRLHSVLAVTADRRADCRQWLHVCLWAMCAGDIPLRGVAQGQHHLNGLLGVLSPQRRHHLHHGPQGAREGDAGQRLEQALQDLGHLHGAGSRRVRASEPPLQLGPGPTCSMQHLDVHRARWGRQVGAASRLAAAENGNQPQGARGLSRPGRPCGTL